MSQERYSEEAAQEILKRAIALHGDGNEVSRKQLTEMAEELGIPRDSLAKAEQGWLADRETESDRLQFREEQRRSERVRRLGFRAHLASYLIVNIFLFLINLITGTGHFWFVYPLLGWGVGMAFHAFAVLQPSIEDEETAFQEWRRQRELGSGAHDPSS